MNYKKISLLSLVFLCTVLMLTTYSNSNAFGVMVNNIDGEHFGEEDKEKEKEEDRREEEMEETDDEEEND